MSITTGSINTPGQGQWTGVNPNLAQMSITFSNQSGDLLVVSWDGAPAAYTHGYRIGPGGNIAISRAAAAAGNGLTFPGGPISMWGPASGQQFVISIDE
jgi:hypothetical protein